MLAAVWRRFLIIVILGILVGLVIALPLVLLLRELGVPALRPATCEIKRNSFGVRSIVVIPQDDGRLPFNISAVTPIPGLSNIKTSQNVTCWYTDCGEDTEDCNTMVEFVQRRERETRVAAYATILGVGTLSTLGTTIFFLRNW